ncbi:MAG: DNA alkylation repair protein [Candidatus Nealsonbacteria bacterium]|nr:DNA alkylation repair protein [Candidatus Nealsonbacteria bacterium]
MQTAKDLQKELYEKKDSAKAKNFQRFFKTGLGEYAEGDVLWGISVPTQRSIAKKYYQLELGEISKLIKSEVHEHRLTGLIILVNKYKKDKEKIAKFYIKHINWINNWDLVDISAPKILGDFYLSRNKKSLEIMAKSNNLWKRRISIITTLEFIRNDIFKPTIKISQILIKDEHDLIHKAVGWMLRELGKRSLSDLENFLNKNYRVMPRTMLRYSIEKFPEERRLYYLNRK